MSFSSHSSGLLLLTLGLLLLSFSCTDGDDDVNLNPRMEKANLPDEIPFSVMGSGKLLFTRYYTSLLIDINDESVSELIIDPVGGPLLSPDGSRIAFIGMDDESESHIYIVDVNSREMVQVTFEAGVEDRSVSWSN